MKTVKNIKTEIEIILKHKKRLEEVTDKAHEAGAWDHDGPLDESVWRAFNALVDLVDPSGWFSWYLYDNDCGEARKLVKYHDPAGRLHKMNIGNTSQLAKLVFNETIVGGTLKAHQP